MPWRRTRDPYAIWVSEVMLQQTRVTTVIPYYERWMKRFPSIERLAVAEDDDVLHAWQGLGYYSRAKSLKAGAREVVRRFAGRVPRDPKTLATLPGIGPYTAGAIASIAFGERAAIVDGNAVRVLTRLYALPGDPGRAPLKAEIWKLAEGLVPASGAEHFNQALMELGATVCAPTKPKCDQCPLARDCLAHARGAVARFPELPKRAAPTRVNMVAAVAQQNDRVLLSQLPDGAPRWAGMWQFPNAVRNRGESSEHALARLLRDSRLEAVIGQRLSIVRHSVTRYRIELEVYQVRVKTKGPSALVWKRARELEDLALPAAHRRIAKLFTSLPARVGERARARRRTAPPRAR